MESKIQIRKVEQRDLDFIYQAIAELENEIFDFEIFKEIFEENIFNPAYSYFIVENEKEGIGFISFHTQKLLHHCGLVGEIQEFYLHPNYRNKGIGRRLIEKVISFADQNGLKSIEVTTNRKRIENVIIYENLGFSLTHHKFSIAR